MEDTLRRDELVLFLRYQRRISTCGVDSTVRQKICERRLG